MRPLNPQLLREAHAARGYIAGVAAIGVASTGLIATQAWLLAHLLGPAIHARDWHAAPRLLSALAVVVAARAALAGGQERLGRVAGRSVIAQLRTRLLRHGAALLTARHPAVAPTEITTLATRGLEALGPYVEGFLPQLILTGIVTPALLATVLRADALSGFLVLGTLPLIPLFMVLIGRFTGTRTRLLLQSLQRLQAQLLDLISGIPTLKALGRERGPVRTVELLGAGHRAASLQTLRQAFLSSFALELLTTLSMASVAVGIGIRLVSGHLDLTTGLFVLILAPEIYAPLRQVGGLFHASADGAAAAEKALEILSRPQPASGQIPAPALESVALELVDASVAEAGRSAPAHLSFSLAPGRGQIVVLQGLSGAGKSTALQMLLGLVPPTSGSVRLRQRDALVALQDVERESYWRQVAWLPQLPALSPGTVLENATGDRRCSPARLAEASAASGFDAVVRELPDGWGTRLGQGGFGLSRGQRQRLALTRTLLSDAPLLILDEPTAHLDAETEQRVLAGLDKLREAGRCVLVVSHRPSFEERADRVVHVHAAERAA